MAIRPYDPTADRDRAGLWECKREFEVSLADDLLETVLGVAREQTLPLDRIVLDVDRENDRARAFYRRHGFEGWGEMVARPL